MKIDKNHILRFFIGVAAASLCALALTLICACALRLTGGASESVLGIINGVIRIFAVGVCCFFYCEKNGLLRGAFAGLCTHLIIFILFGVLGAKFNINARFFINAVICVLSGCVFGTLISNLKRRP